MRILAATYLGSRAVQLQRSGTPISARRTRHPLLVKRTTGMARFTMAHSAGCAQVPAPALHGRHGGGKPPRPPAAATTFGDDADDDDDDHRGLSHFAPTALAAAAAPHLHHSPSTPAPPPSPKPEATTTTSLGGAADGTADDIATIRRLLRNLFQEQMLLDKRLRDLEPALNAPSSLFSGDAAHALAHRWRLLDLQHSTGSLQLTHLLDVTAGTSERHGAVDYALASLHVGPRLQSCLQGTAAGGVAVAARTVASATSFRLWQLQLSRAWGERRFVVVAPLGARFKDIASPLHGSQGEGLLESTREGSPMHSAIHGCGLGARLQASWCSLAVALLGSPTRSHMRQQIAPAAEGGFTTVAPPSRMSRLLGQISVQLTDEWSFGVLFQQRGRVPDVVGAL